MTISCIIPAFNEAGRIGAVISAVQQADAVTEIIVIDDGSTDGTAAAVAAFPNVRLLTQERNQGKSAALARGIREARGTYLLFIDADLRGLAPAHIAALIAPVRDGRAAVSFSLRFAGWKWFGIDPISGERLVPRHLLEHRTEEIAALRPFAVETYMNGLIIAQKLPVAVVPWPGVQSPMKSAKQGFWNGMRSDLRMARDILSVVPPLGYVRYAVALRRLRVRSEEAQGTSA